MKKERYMTEAMTTGSSIQKTAKGCVPFYSCNVPPVLEPKVLVLAPKGLAAAVLAPNPVFAVLEPNPVGTERSDQDE